MDIYNRIKNDAEKVKFQRYMDVGGINIDLATPNVVGNIMQEWLEG